MNSLVTLQLFSGIRRYKSNASDQKKVSRVERFFCYFFNQLGCEITIQSFSTALVIKYTSTYVKIAPNQFLWPFSVNFWNSSCSHSSKFNYHLRCRYLSFMQSEPWGNSDKCFLATTQRDTENQISWHLLRMKFNQLPWNR